MFKKASVRVLALSSGGGHWVQLLRLRPAFEGCELHFATTIPENEGDVQDASFHFVHDANRWDKLGLIRSALDILLLILKVRPDVIISTGAAPGYFAIKIGKLIGAKTVWIDSIANAEKLSLSGQKAGKSANLWITQWEHLAKESGPFFFGNVLGMQENNELQLNSKLVNK